MYYPTSLPYFFVCLFLRCAKTGLNNRFPIPLGDPYCLIHKLPTLPKYLPTTLVYHLDYTKFRRAFQTPTSERRTLHAYDAIQHYNMYCINMQLFTFTRSKYWFRRFLLTPDVCLLSATKAEAQTFRFFSNQLRAKSLSADTDGPSIQYYRNDNLTVFSAVDNNSCIAGTQWNIWGMFVIMGRFSPDVTICGLIEIYWRLCVYISWWLVH